MSEEKKGVYFAEPKGEEKPAEGTTEAPAAETPSEVQAAAEEIRQSQAPVETPTPSSETPAQEEVQADPPPAENNDTEEKPSLDINYLNQALGSEYKDVEDLKSALDKYREDLSNKNKEVEVVTSDYKTLSDFAQEVLGDKDELKKYKIMKELQGKTDPTVALNVLNTDINALTDIDALVLAKRFDNPNLKGGDEGVKKMILAELGLSSSELEDLDVGDQNRIIDMGFQAKQKLNEFKNQNVDLGDVTPLDKVLKQSSEIKDKTDKQNLEALEVAYENNAEILSNAISSISVDIEGNKESFELNEEDRKMIRASFQREFENSILDNVTPTKEHMVDVSKKVIDQFKGANLTRIVNHFAKNTETRVAREKDLAHYNPRGGNRDVAPPVPKNESSEQREKRIQKNYENSGTQYNRDKNRGGVYYTK